ncbi:hypothetical protein F3Y22_tig00111059pilonHSYRG00029 [Hibiscus syriacus]|uniref:Uncharacterized protein n=1 Tax=Hibiscus syriacus TaxID=106335 RepID=A0A6A2Z428_HIBSY|nr:hypothetical protein F3Y22_tig00111059pilonHSYRG00029 [Hibiscus syriacus]
MLHFFLHLHSFIQPTSIVSLQLKRPEKNPLDLNYLPEEYTRDGKQIFEEGSSSERETETVNRARQLVFGNCNLTTTEHLGYVPSSYHPSDPTQSFISVCPPRLFSGPSSPLVLPALQPLQPYVHLTHDTSDYYLAGNRFGHGPTRRSDLVGPRPVGGAGFRDVTQQHLDYSTTNRFEDGF